VRFLLRRTQTLLLFQRQWGDLTLQHDHATLPTLALTVAIGRQPDASAPGGFKQIDARRDNRGGPLRLKANGE
jgi:hypothetical protein